MPAAAYGSVRSGFVDGQGEAEVLARLRAGDEQAFAAIVRDWSPVMLSVARSFVSTRASAEECVQEAWLVVVRGLDGFQGASRLRTWVVGIVVNVARRRADRDGRTVLWESFENDAGPTVDPGRFRGRGDRWPGGWTQSGAPRQWEPERVVLAGEVARLLAEGLAQLPPRQRAVVTLRDVRGFEPEEVCRVLDLTAGNQRVLLHRGRARLRQLLESYHRGDMEVAWTCTSRT